MLLTPTFQVYMGDLYNNSNKFDLLSDTIINAAIILVTIFYSFFLEDKESRRVCALALILEILSMVWGMWCYTDFEDKYETYWLGVIQAGLLDTPYKCLFWMPAYIYVGKMTPTDVETAINSIVKTLQAGSMQCYGRILCIGMTQLLMMAKSLDRDQAVIVTIAIAILFTFLQLLLVPMLATNDDIEDIQEAVRAQACIQDAGKRAEYSIEK